jgi:protein TonB
MNVRFVLAMCASTAAHVGVAWFAADQLASFAAPAQRALTVAMAPAAPRAVLNSIAPSATAALSPVPVEPVAPPSVESIEGPEEAAAPADAEVVTALVPHAIRTEDPARTMAARVSTVAVVTPMLTVARDVAPMAMASSAQPAPMESEPNRSRVRVAKASVREARPKGIPAERRQHAASAVDAGAVLAKLALVGNPGAGGSADAPAQVAGQPGADREASPSAGNEPPVYPWTARAQGHQGRVVVRVWVSAEGDPGKLDVWRSSGYGTLDRAALRAVGKWRFRPARRAGQNAESLVHVPVVFRLEDG